jgi:hypothetical protein
MSMDRLNSHQMFDLIFKWEPDITWLVISKKASQSLEELLFKIELLLRTALEHIRRHSCKYVHVVAITAMSHEKGFIWSPNDRA